MQLIQVNYQIAKKKDLKEHPSLYFYREGRKDFILHNISLPNKFNISKSYRLTMDVHSDFQLLRKIYSYFKSINKIGFKTKDISLFMKKNPKLYKINYNVAQKKVNMKV